MISTGQSSASDSVDIPPDNQSLFENVDDLAAKLGVGVDTLHYWCRKKCTVVHPAVELRGGKERQFYKPRGDFKALLQKIDRQIKKYCLPNCMYGSRRGVSAVDCALVHLRSPIILKTDLASYFPNTSQWRVKNALARISPDGEVADLLMKLCTFANQLPQGFPTSPTIAEMVLLPLARRLNGLCLRYDLKMSIYIDDITISGPDVLRSLYDKILGIIREMRFKLNVDKTELASSLKGAVVTGVLLKNGRASVRPEFSKDMERVLWFYRFSLESGDTQLAEELKRYIKPKLPWLKQVDPSEAARVLQLISM